MATPAQVRFAATELPGRVEAEAELRTRFYADRCCYAAVVTVQRLDLVERHFGMAAAGSCLSAAASRLSRLVQTRDRIYRWSGETLLLLLERPGTLASVSDEVRSCVRSLAPVRLENSALRLRCATALFLLDDFTSPVSLLRKIELSVAAEQPA